MKPAGALWNLVLGLCAIGYSWLPPERVRGYRRDVALLMRLVGLLLLSITVTSLVLRAFAR